MSEKVGRLGRGLKRDDVSSHGRENLQESDVPPDDFFWLPNERHDVISHVIRAF